ncbi:MAG: hypothetical protein A3I39_03365 [Candidatus Yanofskybacteria bacterium RIFCSPLOWO2_02_FULL_47_9b]|uniref:NYN domain-containing protein n=1 Tax=Candidatus Yanofskybacteria bacterium RIFCSPLOWO2_02_FULL_47_9b TaxID=1802708 RepID=A0A1F8HA17_9BACT|nr:MAG: hypothetical protein A3I39_03365 [Candidatus Yanofskybacteria bacterium RIFCSPLOWO2_02_FULL_47_9b]
MKKYAFIDVQNTDTTTKKLLGFQIDWPKFYLFLKNNWKCDKVFIYTGVDEGDIETITMLESLETKGCIVRAKTVFAYKNKDKDMDIICPNCQHPFIKSVDMGYNRKSNCDVELAVDAIEHAGKNNQFYIFTGDGDFEFLIRNINKKETRVAVVSSPRKVKTGPRHFSSRLSTKLRTMISESSGQSTFIDINNIRLKIQK